jgi:hypothetical protein
MKTLSDDLQAHFASGTTTLAWCWRITRADGAVFGFTDHDRMLSSDGTSFESEAGLIPSELRQGSDLSVDAQDAEGVLSSDRITETDILDGRWDNASVEVWCVNWQDTSQRVLLRRGSIGQIRRGRIAFVAEVRSMAHVLNQQVGRAYQAQCDAALGDARCGVDLNNPAFRGEGTVGSVARRRVTFEVFRPLPDADVAEGLVPAVTIIPGSGEFAYAPGTQIRTLNVLFFLWLCRQVCAGHNQSTATQRPARSRVMNFRPSRSAATSA